MQEFMATSERRAELYWWFATLFGRELSEEEIAEYDSYDVRSFLKSLATLDPMRDAVNGLNQAIAALLANTDREASLAHNHQRLFGENALVSPYESAYPDAQHSAERMQHRLERLHIHADDKYSAPFDHLATELDLMGNLIIRAAEAADAGQREQWLGEQEALLREHLLRWFPHVEQACISHDDDGFYAACARLLGVFLTMDANYLTLVKPTL